MERAWASGHLSKFRTHRRNCLELKSATSKVTTNTNLICSLLYFKNWYNFSLSKNIFSGSNYPFQILGLHNAHFPRQALFKHFLFHLDNVENSFVFHYSSTLFSNSSQFDATALVGKKL